MERKIVGAAVQQLETEGKRVSRRTVLAITGGSLREIQRHLRDLRPDVVAADVEALTDSDEDEAAVAVVPPTPGLIAKTVQAAKVADEEAGQAARALDARREQLRDLRAHRPPPAITPADVEASVAARFDHDVEVARLVEEVAQLDRLVQVHMAEARALRIEGSKLEARRRELLEYVLPGARQRLIEAEQQLQLRRQELEHGVRMATRRVANTEQSLASYEQELRTLTGE
jgi:hypothetical protein